MTKSSTQSNTPIILGVCGLIGSGKDTIADYLTTFHGFKRLSFAGSLKDAVAAIFGWDRDMLEGTTKLSREWREEVDTWWSERLGMPNLTPRWVLQHWGTEVCRNNFHTDIWVASIENKLRNTKDNIVITDCRFKNEIEAIKNVGGLVVRVERGEKPDWYEDAEAVQMGPKHIGWAIASSRLEKAKIHASEYSSIGLNYDYVIDNNGTIDELHNKVQSIVNL